MPKLLKRYNPSPSAGVAEAPDGDLLDRAEVIAAIKRRIRTERERGRYYSRAHQEGAIAALEALLERLGEKP
jgi:hypothetical protein